jgi:hypothetical protein
VKKSTYNNIKRRNREDYRGVPKSCDIKASLEKEKEELDIQKRI